MLSSPQIIFLRNMRIPTNYNISALSGEVRFIDPDNYTHICTTFKQQLCIESQVFYKQHRKLKNIHLSINQDRLLFPYGPQVEQYSFSSQLVYKGGYLGYNKHGLGTQYKTKPQGRSAQRGVWLKDKKQGKFILKIQSNHHSSVVLNQYQKDTLKKYTSLNIYKDSNTAQFIIVDIQANKQPQRHTLLTQLQIQQKQLFFKQQQQNIQKTQPLPLPLPHPSPLIQQFCKVSMDMSYDHNDLINKKQQGMLSQPMCQLYLNHLVHQQHYQTINTLIVDLHVSDLIYKYLFKLSEDNLSHELKQQAFQQNMNNYMKRYRGSYNIWRGLWRRIILPLAINDHFSFISISFSLKQNDIRCQAYDSGSPINTNKAQIYISILKEFLTTQLNIFLSYLTTTSTHQTQIQIQTNQSIINLKQTYRQLISQLALQKPLFPQQRQNQSCGVFMLSGIADIMKEDRVTFTEKQAIYKRRAIILKLLYDRLDYFKELS